MPITKQKKASLLLRILVVCIALDQATKLLAQAYLVPGLRHSYLGDLFRWQYSENSGAMLGLGAGLSPQLRMLLLIGFNTLVLAGMLWFTWASDEFNALSVSGAALMIAGGLSNVLDRIFYGGVVIDFMNLGIGQLRSGIFNLADVAIMAGAGLLLYGAWRSARHKNTI